MISQEKGKTHIEGNPNLIVSEIGTLVHRVAETIANNTGVTYAEAMEDIQMSIELYKLVGTGMSPQEALEVLGKTDVARVGTEEEMDAPDFCGCPACRLGRGENVTPEDLRASKVLIADRIVEQNKYMDKLMLDDPDEMLLEVAEEHQKTLKDLTAVTKALDEYHAEG